MRTPNTRAPHQNRPAGRATTRDAVYGRTQSQDAAANEPYATPQHYPDDTLCTGCGLVFRNQRWVNDPKRSALIRASGAAREVHCPACRQTHDQIPGGIVTLTGDYWPQHRDEIMNLVRNEETETAEDNPLSRILSVVDDGETLEIQTTNEKLAQRLGRSIQHAHKGEVDYVWSDGERFVRVNWSR